MVFLLALLSFIAVAAGVFGLGLGIPIRETWFGAALLMAGSVAVTGGFILVGLAAAVHELRQLGQGSKAPLSGMPRPVRPLGACPSIRWISLACEGRIRFCLGA